MYKLGKTIQLHQRDVRCLDYYNNVLITGGNDKRLIMNQWKNGNLVQIMSSDIFESQVLCLKINRYNNQLYYFLAGCRNGHIFAFDRNGNPSLQLIHDNTLSSIDIIDANTIVTGSWDGKAIIWSLSQRKKIHQLTQHKHAVSVFYNKNNGYLVTGSQDKALNMWDVKTGKKIKRLEGAHNDIIRQIADVQNSGMIISSSNDQKLKLWSADLELIQQFQGHTAFIFSVKALKLGKYISGGQDKCIKIWNGQSCTQQIHLPCTVWNVAYDENEDIFVAGSDGYFRSFTTSEERRANPDQEQIFNKQVLESSAKKSGMSQQDIKKLATIHQMNAFKGKKQGQYRMFRNGFSPQAYVWQNSKWVKIGDVIVEGGTSSQSGPKTYAGDKYFQAGQYDYIFDVDDQSGIPKVIPFNDGDNPLEAAQKYCMRQGLTKGFIQQIRKFLIQNSSKIPRRQLKQTESKQINLNNLKCTPSTITIEYNDVKNPQALFNKIKQFNEKADLKKLNEKQLTYIQSIIKNLQNSNTYHSWKLDFKQMDTLKKILTWPKQIKFPVWDIFRAFLKHYQSQSFFSGLQAGGDIISSICIGLQIQNTEPIYALMLKTLSNILIQNTNKNGMIKNSGTLMNALTNISKREHYKNPGYLSSFAGLLYNYSIALIQKNIQKQDLLLDFGQLLRRRLELDDNINNRDLLLQAGANILFKYHDKVKERYKFLTTFLTQNDVSSDIKQFY